MNKAHGELNKEETLSHQELLNTKTLTCQCDTETVDKEKYIPKLKYNIFYIVAAIIINENGEFLLIQEAKSSCCGKWYLPAGRVEENETLIDAAKREVLEEAGLIFDPISLLCVEIRACSWIRFTFIGNTIGGKLKTLENSDSESLQASWFSWPFENVNFRSTDVFHLIDKGQKFGKINQKLKILPVEIQHHCLVVRLILTCIYNENEFVLKVKSNENGIVYLPSFSLVPNGYMLGNVKSLISEYCKCDINNLNVEICGLIGLEHTGDSENCKDGVMFSVLAKCDSEQSLPELNEKAFWQTCNSFCLNSGSVDYNVVPLGEL